MADQGQIGNPPRTGERSPLSDTMFWENPRFRPDLKRWGIRRRDAARYLTRRGSPGLPVRTVRARNWSTVPTGSELPGLRSDIEEPLVHRGFLREWDRYLVLTLRR
jgi:hypothetical protein